MKNLKVSCLYYGSLVVVSYFAVADLVLIYRLLTLP